MKNQNLKQQYLNILDAYIANGLTEELFEALLTLTQEAIKQCSEQTR